MAAKVFEVGDVLPATTQLKISWNFNDLMSISASYRNGTIETSTSFISIDADSEYWSFAFVIYDFNINGYHYISSSADEWETPYTGASGNHNYIILDTSLWTIQQRTITQLINYDISQHLTWEDLNASSGFSITFEENGGTEQTDLTEQTALPNPLPTTTKENHVFAGWYYDNLFTQKATAGDELTANVTLYAKWYTPTTWCEDIADAIREKEGSSGSIKHVDFADRIRGLDTCIYLTQEEYDDITTPNENITYIIVEVE